MKPVARTKGLIVKKETGELFIEDNLHQISIHLNPTSAYVWERCDGRKNTKQIAREMGKDLGVRVSEKVILFALSHLQGVNLIKVIYS